MSHRDSSDRDPLEPSPPDTSSRVAAVAAEVLDLLGSDRQVQPFSERFPGFSLQDAYDVAARVRDARAARGETPVGRKIGFTNQVVWTTYGISAPIWNYMFDTTVHDLASTGGHFTLGHVPEPRIEPEIALHLSSAPQPGMTDAELTLCIDWIAHAFEIVHSIFPGWNFAAADAVAAYGVHTALLLGDKRDITGGPVLWGSTLAHFDVELVSDDGVIRDGHARNVLGSPVRALKFLIDEIARTPGAEPLRAGEIITTGTLTEAMPAVPGQTWSTRLDGIDLPGLRLQLD